MPTASILPLTRLQSVALIVLRIGVPLWIGAGAVGKLTSFDPKTLPPPVLDAVLAAGSAIGMDLGTFVGGALRFFIGAELFVALTILLVPRFARLLASVVLGLFCAILAVLITQQFMKGGFDGVAKGGCGCFGKTSLPAWLMFMIDAALLCFVLKAPTPTVANTRGFGVAGAIAVIAFGVAFVRPTPVIDTTSEPSDTQPLAIAPTTSEIWPAAPATYSSLYFVKWKDAIGKRLVDVPVFLAIERPVPATMLKGPQLIVFYSETCEHCQTLFKKHFAVPSTIPVLRVSIPLSNDRPLPMQCAGCESAKLFKVKIGKSPEYMLGTPPMIIKAHDGVITDVCTNVDDEAALARILGTAPVVPNNTKTSVQPPAVPAATPKAWPSLPAQLNGYYVAEFGQLVGTRLDANDFGVLIQKPPAKLNEGRWIVIYYRQDCDHCQELMMTHFTGALKVPTLAVAVPDADPNGLLDMACDTCSLAQLVKGPDYVIQTPIVVSMQDGVVTCIVEDIEDAAKLEACIRGVK
ncbi:MAG: hypothetical protein EXS10_02100 [Phycisphaerales bacterium]|nr:hypothetical protein [Phycisphaerales bacterium]